MSVLLTGGAGFIGSHTAAELAAAGEQIVLVDDFSNSDRSVVERLHELTGQDILCYAADAGDRDAMERVFSEQEIDAVIHFAGSKAVGESVREPLKYYRNNLGSTLTLLEVMARHGCKRIVFSLRDAAIADPTLSVVLLRYFNPIGAHESALIGERPNGIPNNLMPYITQVAAGVRDKLHVFGDDYPTPDGTGVRDYIHVTDLARGHVAALRYARAHAGTEVFNLGTGKGTSVLELVQAFERATGVHVPYVIDARRPGDIAECYADVDKASRVLGWRAEKTVEDMCRDSWRWQCRVLCILLQKIHYFL